MSPDVLVVGGGLAGIAAATSLAESGARVTLVEGRGALGGRAQSVLHARTGDELDTGQHVGLGCYRETWRLLERLGTLHLVRLQPSLEVHLLAPGGARTSLCCPPLAPPLHLAAGLLRLDALSTAEKARCLRVVGDARARADDEALDRVTVARWLESLGQSENASRVLWTPLTLATLNASPEVAAASHLARVIVRGLLAPGNGSSIALATVGLSRLHGDAARRHLEERGSELRVNEPVTALEIAGGRCVGARLRDGSLHRAGAVVAAVPAPALARLLPPALRAGPPFDALGSFRPSAIVSTHLWLDRPVLETAFAGLLDTETQWAFDRARTWGVPARGGHLVSLVVSGANELAARPREEVRDRGLADLRACLPAAREARVLDWEVVKEREATWVPSPGMAALRFGPATPVPGLVVAGDWTATDLPATLEGASLSGHSAAAFLRRPAAR